MRLVFQSDSEDPAVWRAALEAQIPGLDFRVWPDAGDPAEVDMLLVWRLPRDLARYTRLRFIQLISAGSDQVVGAAWLPPGVPIARLAEPGQVEGMVEYVVHAVLHHHREFDRYARQQRERLWREYPRVFASARTVGIMGLGVLGTPAAQALKGFGFDVRGWSRSGRSQAGIPTRAGLEGLGPFLAGCDIVVAMLPLTPETTGMFDAAFFAAMRPGSYFVNVGRGVQVDQAALSDALRRGHLAGATLDVLSTEPPPADDPIWDAPNLTLTPHVATSPNPASAAVVIADNLRRVLRGEALAGEVSPRRT